MSFHVVALLLYSPNPAKKLSSIGSCQSLGLHLLMALVALLSLLHGLWQWLWLYWDINCALHCFERSLSICSVMSHSHCVTWYVQWYMRRSRAEHIINLAPLRSWGWWTSDCSQQYDRAAAAFHATSPAAFAARRLPSAPAPGLGMRDVTTATHCSCNCNLQHFGFRISNNKL